MPSLKLEGEKSEYRDVATRHEEDEETLELETVSAQATDTFKTCIICGREEPTE